MTREEFAQEFRSLYSASGLTLDAAATLLKTSPLIVSRWLDGISTPHALGRPSVINAIKRAHL